MAPQAMTDDVKRGFLLILADIAIMLGQIGPELNPTKKTKKLIKVGRAVIDAVAAAIIIAVSPVKMENQRVRRFGIINMITLPKITPNQNMAILRAA